MHKEHPNYHNIITPLQMQLFHTEVLSCLHTSAASNKHLWPLHMHWATAICPRVAVTANEWCTLLTSPEVNQGNHHFLLP